MAPSLRRPALRPGWSLLELVVALVIIGIAASVTVIRWSPKPERRLDETAFAFARGIDAARAEAVMRPGVAVLDIDTARTPGPRFTARRLDAALDPNTMRTMDVWTPMKDGVLFGTGSAVLGPLGDSALAPLPALRVRCDMTGRCDLGSLPVVTYYLTAMDRPDLVRAVTLTVSGDARVFRYRMATRDWQ